MLRGFIICRLLFTRSYIVKVSKLRRMRWVWNVGRTRHIRNTYKIVVRMDLKEIVHGGILVCDVV
jgi:hypothetical protein